MNFRRPYLHRLLVHLAAGHRAANLLAELDEELHLRPGELPARNKRWYRRECRSLAYVFGLQRARQALRITTTPRR